MIGKIFPVIDPAATGANIVRLRKARGLSVRDLQSYFGFEEPQAIYKWQRGQSLPSVDNLYALGALLDVSMDEILVPSKPNIMLFEQQADAACCSPRYLGAAYRLSQMQRRFRIAETILHRSVIGCMAGFRQISAECALWHHNDPKILICSFLEQHIWRCEFVSRKVGMAKCEEGRSAA